MKLSHSAVEKYIECPKKYKLHYLDYIREATLSSAFLFGRAMDLALNELVPSTGKDPMELFLLTMADESVPVNFFLGDLDPELFDEDQRSEANTVLEAIRAARRKGTPPADLTARFNTLARSSLVMKGTLLIAAYKEQILPLFKKVLTVQKFFSVDNGGEDSIIGFIDFVAEMRDGRVVIFDNKTSGAYYPDDSVDNSYQLATYKFAMEETYPDALGGYIVLIKKIGKREPKVKLQVVINEISKEFVDKTVERYDSVNALIHGNNFEPNLKSCRTASGFKCPFYDLCHNNSMNGLVKQEKKK